MKKLLSLFLLATLLLPGLALSEAAPETARTLVPLEKYQLKTDLQGEWASSAPEVVAVDEKGMATAVSEGSAVISLTRGQENLFSKSFEVKAAPETPPLIQASIDLAISEWQTALGSTFKRKNKYTNWYYGPSASFGWCGAFTAFSLGEGGVPQEATDTWKTLVPKPDGQPYGVREAGVPKLLAGYTNMDRISNIPRPGYLVIYGRTSGYKTVHVGLVTRVEHRGDGVFLLETVEGNLASRVKRLTYLYDSKVAGTRKNMKMLPEAERTNAEVFQYRLSSEDWRVTAFAQTWY